MPSHAHTGLPPPTPAIRPTGKSATSLFMPDALLPMTLVVSVTYSHSQLPVDVSLQTFVALTMVRGRIKTALYNCVLIASAIPRHLDQSLVIDCCSVASCVCQVKLSKVRLLNRDTNCSCISLSVDVINPVEETTITTTMPLKLKVLVSSFLLHSTTFCTIELPVSLPVLFRRLLLLNQEANHLSSYLHSTCKIIEPSTQYSS